MTYCRSSLRGQWMLPSLMRLLHSRGHKWACIGVRHDYDASPINYNRKPTSPVKAVIRKLFRGIFSSNPFVPSFPSFSFHIPCLSALPSCEVAFKYSNPATAVENDNRSRRQQTRSLGSRFWWLQMSSYISVKRNLKLEANVVVSKCTVYVTV